MYPVTQSVGRAAVFEEYKTPIYNTEMVAAKKRCHGLQISEDRQLPRRKMSQKTAVWPSFWYGTSLVASRCI